MDLRQKTLCDMVEKDRDKYTSTPWWKIVSKIRRYNTWQKSIRIMMQCW